MHASIDVGRRLIDDANPCRRERKGEKIGSGEVQTVNRQSALYVAALMLVIGTLAENEWLKL